jgi:molybdate transport system ATP-binding protein
MPELLFPHHKLSAEARLGALHLHASFSLSAPWTVIFGPSGSGKSSLLQAACGLLPEAKVDFRRASSAPSIKTEDLKPGSVLANVAVWHPVGSLPTHLRALAYAPQHAALFPHLDALDNVRFPSQVANQPDAALVENALSLFQLHSLIHRKPVQLSGGERRRVALARAFAVPNCRLILLDEPFTGLDRALRDELLPKMQAWLAARKIPVLSVTHDVDEALQLNADVIRLNEGRVSAQGPAREVLSAERESFIKMLA